MKFYENTHLCLTCAEYAACFGLDAYKNHKKRGTILTYGRACMGVEALIDYETLPSDRKAAVKEKYGDPYKYIVKQPITDWAQINWNKKAFDFYNNANGKGYILPTGNKLPENYRDKYTKAVTYMDAIIYYTTDKLALKRDFNINMQAFWNIVADVIRAENVAIPPNEKRLKERISKYIAAGQGMPEGFKIQVEEFRFSNDNSKKVKDQLAEDILMKFIELDNKHSDEVVSSAYNDWANANGRLTITPAAVGYRRRNHYHEVIMAREGKSAAYNKYNKQIKQFRPTSPLMLINGDDNVLDLYFTDTTYFNGRKNTNKYFRPVMYVIMDCFNDYILGYAIGETVTIELVKQAYRNAMAHIIELTGQPHLFHQVKSDKWSIDPDLKGDLATFFKFGGETKFFPAQVAQSKYIERVFGKPLHKVLKAFPNYSGANITAKSVSARPNPDALQKRSKDFPAKKHAATVIEMAINTMRHSVAGGTTQTRQQIWVDAFLTNDFCRERAITNERKLELLGVRHQPKEPARLKVNGLNFQLNNKAYSYDIPAALFPENNNKAVEIFYDPANMSEVLVTDGKGIRFVAESYRYQPAALADMHEGDGHLLRERMDDKQTITNKLIDYVQNRDERLEREEIDAQSLIQAGILTKEVNHRAQKIITGGAPMLQLNEAQPANECSIYDEM